MLLKLPYVRQQQQSDCLAACAAMVLAYLHVPSSYQRILQILGTTAEGTPFHRLERLQRLGIHVVRGEGTLATLHTYIASGLPVIVDVLTADLPYWQRRTDIHVSERVTTHAVVVVGIEEETIFVYDPDIEPAPQPVSVGDFELARLNREYRYAVLSL